MILLPLKKAKTACEVSGNNISDHFADVGKIVGAGATHKDIELSSYEVGKEVRDTISRLGGTMPEDLPTPGKSIKQIEKEQRNLTDK